MSGHNLSKIEAAGRAQLLKVEHYNVVLDLSEVRTSPTFGSTTTVTFTAAAGASTWIDLVADSVSAITLNGQPVPVFAFAEDKVALHGLQAQNTLVVDARCKYTRDGTGLHRFVDPVDNEAYLYSQFEVPDARQVFANFEQPDLKAEFSFTVTAPNHWEVVSNGAQASRQSAGEGLDRWTFARTKRMSTYITAIVAGPYHHVHDEYAGSFGTYPLGLYCRKSLAEFLDHEELFKITKQGFAFFEEQFQFGYPFGKYDQLFCPEYNAGAMENAGAVTFLEDYVFRSRVTRLQYEARANTILHEMAHMWFGDLVTMRWWEDLWLNESFAEWAAYWSMARCTEFTDAWTEFLGLRKEWGYRQDQQPTTHPIAAEMVDLESVRPNFDGISYAKGASVLKQLVAYIGEEHFVAGVRTYLQKHQYANAELSDLLAELTAASGIDLKDWMNLWIQTPGVNTLRLEVETDSDGIYTKALMHQEPAKEPAGLEPTLRSHRIQLGFYSFIDGALECTDRQWVTIDGAITDLSDILVDRPRPEVLLINEGDHTFAKIRLDRHSMDNAITNYGAFTSSLTRMMVWMSAWDMTRDGELPTNDWLRLVRAAVDSEPEVAVISILLRYAKLAADMYANPARRGGYYRQMADCYYGAAQNAEPGSDLQLAYVRGLLAFAVDPAHLEWIESLPGAREAEVRLRPRASADRHRTRDRGLDRPTLVEQCLRHVQCTRLEIRGVRDDAAAQHVRGPGDRCECGGDESGSQAFSSGDRLAGKRGGNDDGARDLILGCGKRVVGEGRQSVVEICARVRGHAFLNSRTYTTPVYMVTAKAAHITASATGCTRKPRKASSGQNMMAMPVICSVVFNLPP